MGPQRIHIRAAIFDYGNVLCFPQAESEAERMAQVCGMSLARFREAYWRYRLPYDRADLDREAYWGKVAAENGSSLNRQQIAQIVAIDCEGWAQINEAAMLWVRQMRQAGLRLVLLSNMPAEIRDYLIANHEWPSLFHDLLFSCDLRRAKPEPETYQACLERLQVAPGEVLFLDDRPENVNAALKLGIQGVVFETLEKAALHVAGRYDVPVPGEIRASAPLA
jgi:putative hydrolase of the HAD superfamily